MYCVYTAVGTCCTFRWLAAASHLNVHTAVHIQWIHLKHVEVVWWNKLRINSASSWFLLQSVWSLLTYVLGSAFTTLIVIPNQAFRSDCVIHLSPKCCMVIKFHFFSRYDV
jgi:hypothetical protein